MFFPLIVSWMQVFTNCEAGSQLENLVFVITDSEGNIDKTIHDEDKHGQPHTLTINSDSLEIDDTVRYSFRHGRCTIRSIPLPLTEGIFSLLAVHSRYAELNTVVKVQVENARVVNHKSIRNDEGMGNFELSEHRLCENNQVLRHTPSLNSREKWGAFSPQSSQEQRGAFSPQSSQEKRGAFSPQSSQEKCRAFSPRSSLKQVHEENTREENHKNMNIGTFVFSNHRSRGKDQILRHSPSLKVSQENRGAFSPQNSKKQVNIENAREENSRSTWNDDERSAFSNQKPCGHDQFLPLTPSLKVSRETHGTFSPPSSKKLVLSDCSSSSLMTPEMGRTVGQIKNSAISSSPVSTLQDLENLSQQELADALVESGMAVNDHHTELGKLRFRRILIHQDIKDLQASVDRDFDDVSTMSTCNKELVLKQIESKEESAAFVVCKIPFESRPQDVLGVVALLGTVDSIELSRMLAKFLGEDQMLAIACRNIAAAHHFKAQYLGETVRRGYHVVCLEEIRPRFTKPSSDCQQRLPLEAPTLPNGSVPPAFLGYAVNMMEIEESHTQWRTENGYGLRGTLFYCLFGELQVYKDSESMMSALSCIKDGALSLDGCIVRRNGYFSLGYSEHTETLFPVRLPAGASRALKSLDKKRSEMAEIDKRIDEEQNAYERANEKLCMAKAKYNSLFQILSHCSW